ncbi:MAG: Spy/CpxP family protein refolding chaperone [Vicinamibacteria bacterium]
MSKRTTWMAAVGLAVAVAGAGTLAIAGEGHRGPHGRGGAGFRGFRGLDLTEEQRTQVKAIFEEQRKASEPQRAQMHELRKQMREQLDSGKADASAIGQLAIQTHAIGSQLHEGRERAFERVSAILTPEQKAKLEQMKSERGKRGFGRRGFGPRPGADERADDDDDAPVKF